MRPPRIQNPNQLMMNLKNNPSSIRYLKETNRLKYRDRFNSDELNLQGRLGFNEELDVDGQVLDLVPNKKMGSPFLLYDIQKDIRENPLLFLRDILGMQWWRKQEEIILSLNEYDRISIKSCNGSGKTMIVAASILWYLCAYAPCKVICLAPNFSQVKDQIWSYITDLHENAKIKIGGRSTEVRLTFSPSHFAVGLAVADGRHNERLQGFHNDNILFIIDEASGINNFATRAIQGSLNNKNAKLLMIGNPTRTESDNYFYKSFKMERFKKITISAFEIPNVKYNKTIINGLTDMAFVEEMRDTWGEEHDEYRIRVLGEWGEGDGSSFLSLKDVSEFIKRDAPLSIPDSQVYERLIFQTADDRAIIGVDVAFYGKDKSVITLREGLTITIKEVLLKNDTDELIECMARVFRDFYNERDFYPHVHIDAGGEGARIPTAIYNNPDYADMADFILEIDSGRKPSIARRHKFHNLRAEGFFDLKQFIKFGVLKSDDKKWLDGIEEEMTCFSYSQNALQKLVIESKDSIKNKTGYSPDRADAMMFSFALDYPLEIGGHPDIA